MVRKYEEACHLKYKMKTNRELMMMQKVLLRDVAKSQSGGFLKKCPITDIVGLKRVEIYDDELTYNSQSSLIDMV